MEQQHGASAWRGILICPTGTGMAGKSSYLNVGLCARLELGSICGGGRHGGCKAGGKNWKQRGAGGGAGRKAVKEPLNILCQFAIAG